MASGWSASTGCAGGSPTRPGNWSDAEFGRGDRVVLFGWNSPDFVMNFWACIEIGAIPVLANAWWGNDEIDYALDLLEPAMVLADARTEGKIPPPWRRGPWAANENAPAKASSAPDVNETPSGENEPAVIVFTSGTEGRAKAVVLAHRALLAGLQMMLHITQQLPLQFDETNRKSRCTPDRCSMSADRRSCCAASRSATRWCF